jgi:hypothetical protein
VGGALIREIRKVQPEGSGNIFIIDSKTFTLGFDGGRTDPYHIMERRGRFRGSLWLGLGGLRWLVNVLLKLRNSACTLDGFFEFFRDGYRVVKLSCLSNSGGRFLDISEYHSGARRGSIRLPEGRRGAGWSLFEFQVRKYFFCEVVIPKQPLRVAEEKLPAVGAYRICNVSWNQNRQDRKSWAFRKNAGFAPKLTKTVTISDTEKKSRIKVDMATKAPRPTRLSHFEWKPKSTTLRITVNSESSRIVEWVGLGASNGLKLVLTNGPLNSEAQQPNVLNKEVVEGPLDNKKSSVRQFCVGEASGTKESDTESTPCDSIDEDDDPESETPAAPSFVGSDGVINDIQVDSGEENSCREPCGQALLPTVGADLLRDERMAVSASEASSVVMNGGEEIPLSMVVFSVDHEHKTTEAGSSVDGLASLPASFRLEEPWNSDSVSGSPFLGDFGHYATGETQSPLSCTPLDRIDPLDFAAFTQGYTGIFLRWRMLCQHGLNKDTKASRN